MPQSLLLPSVPGSCLPCYHSITRIAGVCGSLSALCARPREVPSLLSLLYGAVLDSDRCPSSHVLLCFVGVADVAAVEYHSLLGTPYS